MDLDTWRAHVGDGPGAASGVPAGGFEAFYEARRDDVTRALCLTVGDHHLGAEAADEAFARAYARWGEVSEYANPSGWVFRVGLNWARSLARRRARWLTDAGAADALAGEPPSEPPDPAVADAVESLPIKLRAVVVCRHLLDWSVADTAAALGISEGTVKSRLSRALEALRRRLDDDSEEDR